MCVLTNTKLICFSMHHLSLKLTAQWLVFSVFLCCVSKAIELKDRLADHRKLLNCSLHRLYDDGRSEIIPKIMKTACDIFALNISETEI